MGICHKCGHDVADHELVAELYGLQKWHCKVCNETVVGELRPA